MDDTKILNIIIKRFYSKKTIDNIESKILLLKEDSKLNVNKFIVKRITTTILIFLSFICIVKLRIVISFVLSLLWYYSYFFIKIHIPINKRINKLENEALTFFEILTLALQSGQNLEKSLEITCLNIDSEISNKFKKVLYEVKLGKTLFEGLNDIKKSIPSETINIIILNIIQTNVYGNNIIDIIYSQIEFLREKKILTIKSQINKIPIKISIVSVIFVLPLILLIILGPFIINFLG